MLYISLIAILNALGGRWEDVWPDSGVNGRLWCRCLLVGIFSGVLASYHHDLITSIYVWVAVSLGSALWYPWGWSFEEINGVADPAKYPAWIRWIGNHVIPNNIKLRGALMKGLRGAFDILTFALLIPLSSVAMLLWFGTFLQGLIYWLCGKIFTKNQVLIAELVYGAWRGFLIGACL